MSKQPTPDTWMPFYVGDYFADTLQLSTEEHGAYLLLLLHLWKQGGREKFDKNLLRGVTKVSAHKWPKIWAKISRYFYEEGGELGNDRIDQELAIARENSNKARARTRAATEARKGKTKHRNDIATSTPSPSPSPYKNYRSGEVDPRHDHEEVVEFPYRGAYRAWLQSGTWPSREIQGQYPFDYVPPPDHPDHPTDREDWETIRVEETDRHARG